MTDGVWRNWGGSQKMIHDLVGFGCSQLPNDHSMTRPQIAPVPQMSWTFQEPWVEWGGAESRMVCGIWWSEDGWKYPFSLQVEWSGVGSIV